MSNPLRRISIERFAEYFLSRIEVVSLAEPTAEEVALHHLPLNVLLHGDYGTEPQPERVLLETGSPHQWEAARAYIQEALATTATETGQGEAGGPPEVSKQPSPEVDAPGDHT